MSAAPNPGAARPAARPTAKPSAPAPEAQSPEAAARRREAEAEIRRMIIKTPARPGPYAASYDRVTDAAGEMIAILSMPTLGRNNETYATAILFAAAWDLAQRLATLVRAANAVRPQLDPDTRADFDAVIGRAENTLAGLPKRVRLETEGQGT